jgi:hypothetical protein
MGIRLPIHDHQPEFLDWIYKDQANRIFLFKEYQSSSKNFWLFLE